jgi:hypothetical protein
MVPWTALVLGTSGGRWSSCLWPRDRKSVTRMHCIGLVASNHLRIFVFVSGEPISEAHIRTTGVGPGTEDHES